MKNKIDFIEIKWCLYEIYLMIKQVLITINNNECWSEIGLIILMVKYMMIRDFVGGIRMLTSILFIETLYLVYNIWIEKINIRFLEEMKKGV